MNVRLSRLSLSVGSSGVCDNYALKTMTPSNAEPVSSFTAATTAPNYSFVWPCKSGFMADPAAGPPKVICMADGKWSSAVYGACTATTGREHCPAALPPLGPNIAHMMDNRPPCLTMLYLVA